MKRLVFFISKSLVVYGGFEKVLSLVVQTLKQQNIDVVICNFPKISSKNFDKSNLVEPYVSEKLLNIKHTLPSNFLRKVYLWSANYKIFFDDENAETLLKNSDLAIVTEPFLIQPSKRLFNSLGVSVPIIGWFHNSLYASRNEWLKNIKKIILNPILRKHLCLAEYFICISSGIARQITKICPEKKTFVVFNPVLKPDYLKQPAIVSSPYPVFAVIGRIEDGQKNLRFLFRTLRSLKFEWKLKIIGKGPSETDLKKYAEQIGISNNIDWIGFSQNPFEELRKGGVTLILLSSRFEGLPTVLIEAISYGIPILAADCETGPADIVIPGVNGYLYKPGSKRDFLEKLIGILEGNLVLKPREEIQKTADRFLIDKNVQQFVKVLEFATYNQSFQVDEVTESYD